MEHIMASSPVREKALGNALDDFSSVDHVTFSQTVSLKDFSLFGGAPKEEAGFSPIDLIEIKSIKNQAIEAIKEELEQLKAEFNEEKLALEEKHKQALENLAKQIRAEESTKIKTYLDQALEDLRSSISEQVAIIISSFAMKQVKKQAVEEFAQKIKLGLRSTTASLSIEGNKELLDMLKLCLGIDKMKFKFTETSTAELSFKYNDKILSTNIETLLNSLGRVKI